MPNTNPVSAWKALKEGNERFLSGNPLHPSQSIETRNALVNGQKPTAVIFGCGDSRVAAEIIFDQGLGDMFVVRTAGHVIDSAVLGSIEYGVGLLNVPLVVVLGHDSCGAVRATIDSLDTGELPGGYIRSLVEGVAPSILQGRAKGVTEANELGAFHAMETGRLLMDRSRIIADRVDQGSCAIVGATYTLSDGGIKFRGAIGDVGEN